MKNHAITKLHFDNSFDMQRERVALYPYESTELRVIFVYAKGHVRKQIVSFPMDEIDFSRYDPTHVTFFTAAIILFIIRLKARIHADSFVRTYAEVFTAAGGGGPIRCKHKLERLFFAVWMIGSFFFVSIFSAEHTMRVTLLYTPSKPKMVNTFQDLSEENVSFYMSDCLAEYQTEITDMLR